MLGFEDAQEVILTVAEQLEQKGIEQGIEQGKILVASKLLYKKFGRAAKLYQDRLASLSTDELEIL